jgi:hydroxymethylpyrimidine/phosphomethylpyrimidine kinase
VADALEGSSIPLVLDTVLLSSSGAPLLDEAGTAVLKDRLIRRSRLVTPNLLETEILTGFSPKSEDWLRNAATAFEMLGADHVLFKGGHALASDAERGEMVRDMLWSGGAFTPFVAPRQDTRHTHGTGCTLATAIACGLALQRPLNDAVVQAQAYVQDAIRTAPGLGAGAGPLNHLP